MKKLLAALGLVVLFATPALAFTGTVGWTNPVDSNRTGIRVERSDNGGAFVNQTPTLLAADVVSFSQSGLVVGTAYCWRVIANSNVAGDAAQPWPQVCATINAPQNVTAPLSFTATP